MKTILRSAVVAMAFWSATAQAQDALERGAYLASIMDCGGCHTQGALAGKPEPAMRLGGSDIGFGIPEVGVFYPPNLTPDRDTGLGTWSAEEVLAAIRTGVRPDGRLLAPVMPWPSYAALTDEDGRALVAFLKSLPPVKHAVPPPVGPTEAAPAPYLGLHRPK